MANLFLTGSGVPTNAVGEVSDYYRDTASNLIYYRAALGWEAVPSLIPTPDGVGTNWLFGTGAPNNGIGATNDYYRDTTTNLIYYRAALGWEVVPSLVPTPDGVGTTWLFGTGAPDNGIGSANDYYRDDANGSVYRKHAVNGWEAKGSLDFMGVYGVQWGEGTGAPANIPALNNLPAGSFYLDVATSDIYYKNPSLVWEAKGQLGLGSTGLDAVATAADRTQTGLDRVQTGLDVIAANADAVATAADRVQTGLDVIATSNSATAAATSEANAAISETNALAYKTASEAARDAAIIGSGVYETEAAGRAAVADGVAFKVQGAGDVAAYEYRRTNSGASVLIATYPSISSLSSKVATTVVSKNLVDAATVQAGKTVHTDGTLLSVGSFSASDYIAVTPLTTYTKTASSGAWAEYDANKTFISYTNLTATITTGATTAFIRASILTGASFDVQKGGVLGDADTYATKSLVTNQYLDLSIVKPAITQNNKLDNSILLSARQTSFLTRSSPNLFDINTYSASTILACATVNSILYATTKTNAAWFTSDLIPVAASTAYTFSKFGVWVQYDVNMNVVAYNTTGYYLLSTITTHASAAFIRISYPYSNVDAATTMFCLASQYPSLYIPYNRYVLSSDVSADSAWRGKKILWLGTSIPTGGGYPENVSSNLSATLNKQTISGGRARARKSDGGWFVQSDFIYTFTLSKADINARYGANLGLNVSASDYLTLSGGGPVLTQDMLDALTASNYEVRLVPYIAESSLFVLDYGINDRNGQLPTISVPFLTCEQLLDAGDLYNRNEFLGAMNFLIKTIQDAKAALSDKNYRIVIINHHNRGTTASSERNVVTAQENLAKYWGFPLINVADNVGVNPSTLAGLTNSGDGLHFVPGSNLEKRYTRYITAKLREIDA